MRRKRNQKGFTLMELMVVIVIVAILAAVAVPLYINYVKDARRTEAKAAIGALATAMEEYYLNKNTYANDVAMLYTVDNELQRKPTNLAETTVQEILQHWDPIAIQASGDQSYNITLTGKTGTAYNGLGVKYTYTRGTGGQILDADPQTGP